MKIDCSEATIMIVDDEPENLNVLESLLTLVGYRVSAFRSGEMALAHLGRRQAPVAQCVVP